MGWARRTATGWVEDTPPDSWDDGRGGKYDLRSRDPALMAYCGWQPVAEEPRPQDTDTTTYDRVLQLTGGRVGVVWTPRPWTSAELAARTSQAARLTTIEARLAALEALVLARVPAPTTVPVWDGAAVEPGGHRIIAGVEWINISGAWLVHGPAVYPRGWRQAGTPAPNPETPVPWAEGLQIAVGDLVTDGGVTWRALVAHTSHAGWRPGPATYAVWAQV